MEIDNFRGVYSSREPDRTTQIPGSGKTRKRYWLVWDDAEDTVAVQPLSSSLEPVGVKRIIPLEDLNEQYSEEPEIVPSFSVPNLTKPDSWERITSVPAGDIRTASDTSNDAESGVPSLPRDIRRQAIDLDDLDFLQDARTEPAAPEVAQVPASAPAMDPAAAEKERGMRADFAMALMYLKQGDTKKAQRVFEALLSESDLVPAHKHMFTDFGISLRKSKLLDMALNHHLKVVELSGSDENAHHNVARIYFEMGDINNAIKFLKRSLELNPALDASERFMRFIRKRQTHKPLKLDI